MTSTLDVKIMRRITSISTGQILYEDEVRVIQIEVADRLDGREFNA